MHQFDIEKVRFLSLNETRYDRRGTIAIFYLKKYNDWQLAQTRALEFLWRVTALLSDIYRIRTRDEIMDSNYMTAENECWIGAGSFDEGRYQIRVSHKHWDEQKVVCFKEMILSLAKLHGWEVDPNQDLPYVYRGLPYTAGDWYVEGDDGDGGGVLEWCTDKDDAEQLLKKMQKYKQFSNLEVHCWVQE